LDQDIKKGDILFTNDGKIGLSAVLLDFDNCIIQSHIRRIRTLGKIPQWFLFAFLITKFARFYFNKNTVIQSTIPTIRDSIKFLPIPILNDATVDAVCEMIQKAVLLKNEKKCLLSESKILLEQTIFT